MESTNCCSGCIGENGNECCYDVFLILNPDEVHLFNKHTGYKIVENGALFYTTNGCPYFKDKSCQIHNNKPLYCKFYPIFITGKPFIDKDCRISKNYKLNKAKKKEISELKHFYPIYKKDWYWQEVKEELNLQNNI